MRLPLSKVYRAFPELDRFSDEQCRAWQQLANDYWPWKRIGALLLAVAMFPVMWAGLMTLVTLLGNWSGFRPLNDLPAPFGLMVVLLFVALPIFAAALVSLSIRDWWTRRCLRRFIDDRICSCGYSLLGLPHEPFEDRARVHCPECGTWHKINNAPERVVGP